MDNAFLIVLQEDILQLLIHVHNVKIQIAKFVHKMEINNNVAYAIQDFI